MINPYEILKINQDADKKEIVKAKMLAMKEKQYTLQEIQLAEKSLLNPAKRLAADFMYPSKLKTKRHQKILIDITIPEVKVDEIDYAAFDSLR